MDGKEMFPTNEGTSQGGVLSPLLANVALHGMETRIRKLFPEKYSKKNGWFYTPRIILYADDFICLHEDITVIQKYQQTISEWLANMGLELKPSKTRITHTLEQKTTLDSTSLDSL